MFSDLNPPGFSHEIYSRVISTYTNSPPMIDDLITFSRDYSLTCRHVTMSIQHFGKSHPVVHGHLG
jgi:hypothetical protein